jgi:hypothetical protein
MLSAKKMMRLFPGLIRTHGEYNPTNNTHKFVQGPLTIQQYIDHIEGRAALGIVPINEDNKVQSGSLDIDDHKKDKTKEPIPWSLEQYKKLTDKIKFLKLPLTVFKSKSGGAHCHLFLDDWVSAKLAQDLMNVFQYALGYEGIEVFPKQTILNPGDSGSFINLPYFNGNSRVCINFDNEELNLDEGLDYSIKRTVKLKNCLKFFLLKQGTRTQHRNDRTWCAAAFLKKQYPNQWEQKTKEYNQLFNEPPLGEGVGEDRSRLEKTILKSHRNKEYNKQEDNQEEPPQDFWEGFNDPGTTDQESGNKNKFPKLEIITGDNIFFSEDIPINFVIENILPEGMTILAALPKIGKSFFALQISLAVENALEVLGFKVKEGRALYCAYEDNRGRIKRRFKTMGVKPEDKKPDFIFNSCSLTEGLEDQIENWIKETPDAQLVVIDTYAKTLPKSNRRSFKERYEIDSQNLSGLQRLALDYNISILIIHHTTKGKLDDTFNEISGSVGIQAIADTLWVISSDRKKGKDPILEITGRDIEQDAFQIGLDVNCKWLNKGKPGENQESEDQKQITNTIKELDQGHGVYPRDVVAHLSLNNTTEIGNLKKRMKRMLEKNELMKGQKHGQYKNLPF